jgi:hypothetical protein
MHRVAHVNFLLQSSQKSAQGFNQGNVIACGVALEYLGKRCNGANSKKNGGHSPPFQ